MHLLHLLRHAKSLWKGDAEDHERPLSRRGRKAARLVGRHLAAAARAPDLILCSSAARTRQTLDLVLAELGARPRCAVEDELYLAGPEKLLGRIARLAEADRDVLLIGHNPGLHELAVALADPGTPQARAMVSGKFPTAAYVSLRVATGWAEIGRARHAVAAYVTPELLGAGEG
jgi:phosphohistidine phosphatase